MVRKDGPTGRNGCSFALGALNATAFGKGPETATAAQRRLAIAWLSKASAQGHDEAESYLDLLGNTRKPM